MRDFFIAKPEYDSDESDHNEVFDTTDIQLIEEGVQQPSSSNSTSRLTEEWAPPSNSTS
jgi:hypothetical protein